MKRTAKDRFSRALRPRQRVVPRAPTRLAGDAAPRTGKEATGHYAYFGITPNYRSISRFAYAVMLVWWRALKRRSQRGFPWRKMQKLLKRLPLPAPRIVHRYGP
jgi:hypothetical protein